MKEPSPDELRFEIFPLRSGPTGPVFVFRVLATNQQPGSGLQSTPNRGPRGPPVSAEHARG